MKVLLISPEAGRWPYPSALADTVNQLARAYRDQGVEIRVYSPCYCCRLTEEHCPIVYQGRERLRDEDFQVCHEPGSEHFHIDHPGYFGRDGLYNDADQIPYGDNHLRFSLLVSAVLTHASQSGFIPDVVHAHEWGGALAGALMRGVYAREYGGVPFWFTVHNMEYDFHFWEHDIERVGLDRKDFTLDGYEFWGKVSMLKAGILYADRVTVTSKGYRGQLLRQDLPGGIRGFLEVHWDKLYGIQHGVDYEYWDIFRAFDNLEEAKEQAKRVLCERIGFSDVADFLIYVHLDKETAATAEALWTILYDLMQLPVRLVIGVVGNVYDREYLASLARQQSGKIAVLEMERSGDAVRAAMAGADLLWVSHTEEPSGAMILKAMACAVVPLTAEHCGCAGLLVPLRGDNFHEANAFLVEEPWPDQLLRELRTALDVYGQNPQQWAQMRRNAYGLRQLWADTARNYLQLLKVPS